MKRSFRMLLMTMTLLLLFSVAPYNNFSAKAAAKESYLTVNEAIEWLDSTVGTKRGDGQCIAFIKDYYQVLTGYIPSGNACEYSRNTLPSGFGWKRIRGEKNLKKGDILIWTHGTAGNGHAAIYGGDGKYYHQKWTGMYVEIIGKSYLEGFSIRRSGSFARYWGVIRPNFRSESISEKLSEGNYRVKNAYNGRYLTAKNDKELTSKLLISLNSKKQLFTADKSGIGYKLSALSSSSAVGAVFEEGKTRSGATVKLFKDDIADAGRWRFDKVSGLYVIRNVYNPTLCLTSSKHNGKLTVESYKGTKNQKWKLENVSVVSYDANGGWNNPSSSNVEAGKLYKLSSKRPDRIGYEFLGWAKTKNSSKATFLSGSLLKTKGNTTLYAVWKKNKKYEIASVKLSEKEYTYDGKVKTPKVTVKDTNGNTLRDGTDYTVSYSKGRKNVGKYKITVTYRGKFRGKDKIWFTIVPPATKITELSCVGNRVDVKYKKQSQKSTGYALQYSTCPDFSKGATKTVIVNGIKKTTATIKNLAADTKWYVRVCSINKNEGATYYSNWSSAKSIKTGIKA